MFAILVAILVALVGWWLNINRLPSNFPPGPPFRFPVIGSLPFFGTHAVKGFRKFKERYGDIYHVYLGPRLLVVLNSYELTKEAFSRDDIAGRSELSVFRLLRGGSSVGKSPPGVVSSFGYTWMEQRRFALSTLRDLGYGGRSMDEIIMEDVNHFLEKQVPSSPDGDGAVVTVDGNLFNASVLSSLWRLVSGERLSEDKNQAKLKRLILLASALMREWISIKAQILLNYDRAFLIADTLRIIKIKAALDNMFNFVTDTINEHRETFQNDHLRDFIDAYLHKSAETLTIDSSFSARYADLNLRNVLVDFFVAGSDTTSATLRWAALFLTKHGDVRRRIQAELDTVVGRTRAPAAADRGSLPYTEAALQEIQRRGSVALAGISHTTLADVHIGGYLIPRGTAVISNLEAIMHDERTFEDPFAFKPERYLDEEGQFVQNPKSIPFGCLGENLARSEIFFYVTGLLHKFDLEALPGEDLDEEPVMGVVLTPKPFSIRLIPRT